jgi:signal transduction histidine kinase
MQWSNLEEGLESTLNVVWNELKYKAEVIRDYGKLPEVECIPSQINQVFMNLLVNAVQSIKERGRITLRTRETGEFACIEISDTGAGIPPEIIKRIFDPFFTTKPVGTGTGLGLSITHSIIRKHNGVIEVASEVGRGTTFRIFIPIKQARKSIGHEGHEGHEARHG